MTVTETSKFAEYNFHYPQPQLHQMTSSQTLILTQSHLITRLFAITLLTLNNLDSQCYCMKSHSNVVSLMSPTFCTLPVLIRDHSLLHIH